MYIKLNSEYKLNNLMYAFDFMMYIRIIYKFELGFARMIKTKLKLLTPVTSHCTLLKHEVFELLP